MLLYFFQTSLEKQNKCLHGDISDSSHRLDELQTALGEADLTKKRLAIEKADLEKQLNDGDNTIRNLSKLKTSLSTQVTKNILSTVKTTMW